MEPRADTRRFADALPAHVKAKLFDVLYSTATSLGDLKEWLAPSLCHVARHGDVDLVRELLMLGASPDTALSNGDRVLHVVAAAGNHEAVRVLLGRGALVDAQDRRRRTPLQLAAMYNHPRTASALLASGASSGYRRRAEGSAALELAAEFGFVGVIDTLVRHGANVDAANSEGSTALHRAAAGGHVGAISALLEARASINARGPNEMTPLHVASDKNEAESVRVLCELGAEKHAFDWSGRAPLHCASNYGSHSAVVALLNAGADPNLREGCDDPNWTNSSALYLAVEYGHLDIVKTLIKRGVDINSADSRGSTALHAAACMNRFEAIDALAQSGANLDATDLQGRTPLHRASRGMQIEAARALLRHGASVNTIDARGQSPLHVAASASLQDSCADMVALLLRWDANELAVDKDGNTPAGVVGRDAQEHRAGQPEANLNPSVLDLLAHAAVDRTWRRRRVPVMCRARFGREQQSVPERADEASRQACGVTTRKRAKLAMLGERGDAAGNNGGRGIAHRGAVGRASVGGLGGRVVRMQGEEVFRHMMTFL